MQAVAKGKTEISVIVPTTCEEGRKHLLTRAIRSIQAQENVDIELIIVVNGKRVFEQFYEELCGDQMLRITRLKKGSLPAAQRHGRELVTKEFFTLLDDDDELLSNALTQRSRILLRDQTVDAVVSNGYFTYDGSTDKLHAENFEYARRAPFEALMEKNWLASCGALFRTKTIPVDFFDGVTKYHEWTLLAVKIVLAERQLAFIDQPTFRKHEEVENSLSKSEAYRNSELAFLNGLLKLDMGEAEKTALKKKIGRALHAKSDESRRCGEFRLAWKYHLQSLMYPDCWKNFVYTRKLLIPMHP